MNVLQATVLEKEIDRQLKEKEGELLKEVASGCDGLDSTEVLYKMILNATVVSIKVSVGITLDMMIELGLVAPASEEQLRKKILSIVK